ncbi:MAG: hypothetical protein IJR54_00175 [Oscillibacter sp.]|nr:hypothetical protein [Oscillibacter sp.]
MKARHVLLILMFLFCLPLSACKSEPKEPPDLRGQWRQILSEDGEEPEYYHIANITGDYIEIYYYYTADQSTNLYWYGTFTPPEDGKEPYVWVSENNLPKNISPRLFRYASRDANKEFTYKKGKLTYTIAPSQALRMNVTMEPATELYEIRGDNISPELRDSPGEP